MPVSLKNIESFEEIHDFQGCGCFDFSKISSVGGLKPSFCVVVYGKFDGKL